MQKVHTVHSPANQRSFPVLVVRPVLAEHAESKVAVFLHGRQRRDDYSAEQLHELYPWGEALQRAAQLFATTIVIPLLGSKAHLDSPIDPTVRRATFLIEELPRMVCELTGLRHERQGWSIHGFSMGGTAAINILARAPDTYSIAGNFGGNCDPAFMAKVAGVRCPAEDVLGPYPASSDNYELWSNETAIRMLRGRKDVGIVLGCGLEDTRLDMVRRTRDQVREAGTPSVYIDYPGAHVYDATHMMMQLAAAESLLPLIGVGCG